MTIKNELSELNSITEKRQYFPQFLSDKGFKGINVKGTLACLHERLFKITLTILLNLIF